MEQVELKPCPFCGSEAEGQEWHTAHKWFIQCSNSEYEFPDGCPANPQVSARTRGQAELQWNIRSVAARDEEIARLREALEQIHAWTNAYPTKVFKEPNLAAVRALLEKNDMLVEMDRMHASWARDIVAHIAGVTGPALETEDA